MAEGPGLVALCGPGMCEDIAESAEQEAFLE